MSDVIEVVVKTYGRDLLERVVTSAVGGFAAALVPVNALDGSMWWTAAAAGIAAAVSAFKGFVAKAVGNPDSASLSRRV